MKAKIKYLPTAGDVKELTVDNFSNLYIYETMIEVRSSDGDFVVHIENSMKIQKENFVSITIEK